MDERKRKYWQRELELARKKKNYKRVYRIMRRLNRKEERHEDV